MHEWWLAWHGWKEERSELTQWKVQFPRRQRALMTEAWYAQAIVEDQSRIGKKKPILEKGEKNKPMRNNVRNKILLTPRGTRRLEPRGKWWCHFRGNLRQHMRTDSSFSIRKKVRYLMWAWLTYPLRPNPGANPTGRFANKPMRKLHRADIAAVEVIRSWRTSATQAR